MRGSILVTFDELVDDRGIDSFQVLVNGLTRDIHYVDVNNYYSTYCFPNDVIRINLNFSSDVYPIYNIIRKDYTTDAEGTDRGIKETPITPTVLVNTPTVLTLEFTASTVNNAYNFHYVIDTTTRNCFDSGTGYDNIVTDVAYINNNTNIAVLGAFTTYNDVSANRVNMINTFGAINGSFVNYEFSGSTPTFRTPETIDKQSTNKIIVGGRFQTYSGVTVGYIVRLNTNGTIDTTFPSYTGGGFNNIVTEVLVLSNDKIMVDGAFSSYNGVATGNNLIRLNSNGTQDNTFNFYGSFAASTLLPSMYEDSTNKLLVGLQNVGVIRVNTDGSQDTSFADPFQYTVNALILQFLEQADGKYLIGGNFSNPFVPVGGTDWQRRLLIIRVNNDGTIDNTFNTNNTGTTGNVRSMVYDTDNKLIAGGSFTTFGGQSTGNIVKLNSDGSVYQTFTGFNGEVTNIKVLSNGKKIIFGYFTEYNGVTANRIIKLNSDFTIDEC